MIYISSMGIANDDAIYRMVEEIPKRFYATVEETRYRSGNIECVCLVPKRVSDCFDVNLYITIYATKYTSFTDYEIQECRLSHDLITAYKSLESALQAYETLAYVDGYAKERG